MFKQSSKSVCTVSSEKNFRRKLRRGQEDLLAECKNTASKLLNVKWPGGYGKSLGIALAFRAMLERGKCDRLLIVVANDTQREQMLNDFRQDCADVALQITSPWKITNEPSTYRANRESQHVVFVTTIQQVYSHSTSGFNGILALLQDGSHNWMLAADEYHHYAEATETHDAKWGPALKKLVDHASFTLATSATPYRDGSSTIFGRPHLEVSYAEARAEKAVKPIARRRYEYRIDYIDKDGNPIQFTSQELRDSVGNASNVDRYEATQQLRHTSKYILPIVSEPLLRLQDRRMATGMKLQMLVRAMGCKHAQEVCNEIRAICEDLTVDWIGTGEFGRSDAENKAVKSKFCPAKQLDGSRPEPELDVLVQVGMADEGFDSIMVCEIVDLHICTLDGASTKTKQFYKRGTRAVGDEVLFINVGTDHPLAALEGNQVEAWLDSANGIESIAERVPPDRVGEPLDWIWPDTLFESQERLEDCELTDTMIDEHPLKPRFDRDMRERYGDPTDEELRNWFRTALSAEKKELPDVTLSKQRMQVNRAIGSIAHRALQRKGGEFQKSMLGDYKKRINTKLISVFGRKRDEMLVDELARAYDWLRDLKACVDAGEVPVWLR